MIAYRRQRIANALFFFGDIRYLCEMEIHFLSKTGHHSFGLYEPPKNLEQVSEFDDMYFSPHELKYMRKIKDNKDIIEQLSRADNFWFNIIFLGWKRNTNANGFS